MGNTITMPKIIPDPQLTETMPKMRAHVAHTICATCKGVNGFPYVNDGSSPTHCGSCMGKQRREKQKKSVWSKMSDINGNALRADMYSNYPF